MQKPEYIQIQVTKEEKQLLTQIANQNGRAGMSATIRRLIRNEAQQRGIEAHSQEQQPIINE